MKLTSKVVACYIGGEIMIRNQRQRTYYRGKITVTNLNNGVLRVTFEQVVRGIGSMPDFNLVKMDRQLTYEADLRAYDVRDIGAGRILLRLASKGEVVVLYPANAAK